MEMMQVCTSCNKEKPLNKEHWHIKRATKTGFNTMCKVCRRNNQNKYYENNKEEINEKRRKAYQENPEEILTKVMEYRRNNPDKVREWAKRHYENNKEVIMQRNREYIKKNKDRIVERDKAYYKRTREKQIRYSREYRKNNPEVVRRQTQVRRAREKLVESDFTEDQWIDTLRYFNHECSYCGIRDVPLEQEHIIPLYLGGGYTKNNIIPACKSCNSSKDIKLVDEWFPKQETYTEERLEKIKEYIKENSK